jgi:hypothetical protein
VFEVDPCGHLTSHNKPYNWTLHHSIAKNNTVNNRRVSSVTEVGEDLVKIAVPEVALHRFNKGQFILFQMPNPRARQDRFT